MVPYGVLIAWIENIVKHAKGVNEQLKTSNIGILRMTGEVTDRFNEITLFGMALFWQKAIEFFTKFIIHFLTYRVERLFNSEFTAWQKAIEFFTKLFQNSFSHIRSRTLV